MNRWNNAVLYRYNPDGPGGGPGTLADSISGYNGGTGAIRDLTSAPDGSGPEQPTEQSHGIQTEKDSGAQTSVIT